ncbi:MAG: hypothetical protein ACREIW_15485, partial [Chthoniobacterales bacterium]
MTPFIVPTRWSSVPKSVVSVMMALATEVSSLGVLRAQRATKWIGTPHLLTLAEERAAVKKWHGGCCSIANVPFCAFTPTGPCGSVNLQFSLAMWSYR